MSELNRLGSFVGDRVADWAHRNAPLEVLGRADPQEFEQETARSKGRIVLYGAGLAVSSMLLESNSRLVRGIAKAGVVVTGAGAWNNASKVLLYGHGPNEQQTQRVREAHPEFIPPNPHDA